MTYPTFLELWKSDRQKCYEWLARCEGVPSKSQRYVPGCAGSFSIHDAVERERTVWQYKGDWHTTPPDYSLGENVWRMRGLAIKKSPEGFAARLWVRPPVDALPVRGPTVTDLALYIAAAPDTAILWAAGRTLE